jgi:hypothetical protein
VSARDEALRVGVRLGWLCLPLRYSERSGKWICCHKYGDLGTPAFSAEAVGAALGRLRGRPRHGGALAR